MIKNLFSPIKTKIEIKQVLKSMSCDFESYLKYREAMNQTSYTEQLNMYHSIVDHNECYSLKQLSINGSDLVSLGYQGKQISETLNQLLDEVIEEKITNNKEILLEQVKGCH
jgi:tRNA nucleotidyltransferase (CCA-adding enzyme)